MLFSNNETLATATAHHIQHFSQEARTRHQKHSDYMASSLVQKKTSRDESKPQLLKADERRTRDKCNVVADNRKQEEQHTKASVDINDRANNAHQRTRPKQIANAAAQIFLIRQPQPTRKQKEGREERGSESNNQYEHQRTEEVKRAKRDDHGARTR